MRIGHGYDVHALAEERPLIIGGVNIPHIKGLLGHSDADVLVHAVIDALLGAAGLGDIGGHFPDSNAKYKNADSLKLLAEVRELTKGYQISNIDATVIAQEPKLSPYREQMSKNIAEVLEIAPDLVNIKFKTEENLGFTGAKQGIAAHAVTLLIQRLRPLQY